MMNKDILRGIIDTCLNEGQHLTKWEENFLYDMEERLSCGRTLSEREEEILNRIHMERADG